MVEVVGHKLATHHPVIEPVSVTEPGTEIYDAETGPKIKRWVSCFDRVHAALST
jgi:hypothetical protein